MEHNESALGLARTVSSASLTFRPFYNVRNVFETSSVNHEFEALLVFQEASGNDAAKVT